MILQPFNTKGTMRKHHSLWVNVISPHILSGFKVEPFKKIEFMKQISKHFAFKGKITYFFCYNFNYNRTKNKS